MKLSKFLYNALVYDEFILEDVKSPEDLPFEITQEELDKITEKEFYELCNKWWEDHNIDVVEDEIVDWDLEKSYLVRRMVFRHDYKFYAFKYYYSIYWDDDEIIDKELDEVTPHEKMITVYL